MRSPVELQKELVCIDVKLKSLIRDVLAGEQLEAVALKNREASEAIQEMNCLIRDVECLANAATKTNREEMMSLVETYRKVQLDNQVGFTQRIDIVRLCCLCVCVFVSAN